MKRSSLVKILISLAYAVLLSWLYRHEVAAVWGDQGFRISQSTYSAIPIILTTLGVTLILPNNGDTRSTLLMSCYFLFFAPSFVFAFLSEANPHYISLLFLTIVIVVYVSSVELKAIRWKPMENRTFLAILTVFSLLVLTFYSAVGGIVTLNFDLSQVYAVRASNAGSLPGFLGYFVSLLSVVLLPMMMLYGISLRRYALLSLAVVMQLVFFGMTNFKNILFSPIIVIGMYVFLRNPARRTYLPIFFFLLPLSAVAEYIFVRSLLQSDEILFFVNNFIRRLLFVPPMLDERHVIFFSENPLYYWSSSRITLGLVDVPYNLAAPFIIGREYFGSETWAANTGIIGSGFANAGPIGVVIYAILFGLVLALLNAFGNRIGHAFVSSLALLSVMNITRSSDFTTVLLTHSLIFLLAFLVIAPEDRDQSSP